jgi:hypothetical protein
MIQFYYFKFFISTYITTYFNDKHLKTNYILIIDFVFYIHSNYIYLHFNYMYIVPIREEAKLKK